MPCSPAPKSVFGELTGALAELTARRNQLESGAREQANGWRNSSARSPRSRRKWRKIKRRQDGAPDLEALSAAVEAAQKAVTEAEAAALRAEAAHSAARQALDVARQPLAEAERRTNRLEAEARTLAKILACRDQESVAAGHRRCAKSRRDMRLRWAPRSATISKRRSIHRRRCAGPAHRSIRPIRLCRKASNRSTKYVKAPPNWRGVCAQIGLVTRDDIARLAAVLKPGQRLVSREGDLWRWDGFAVAANAPTGAARRLAERNRLAEIEAELQAARAEVEAKRQIAAAAEAEVAQRPRPKPRRAPAGAKCSTNPTMSRERHSLAEREINQHAARLSALDRSARPGSGEPRRRRPRRRTRRKNALAELAPVGRA